MLRPYMKRWSFQGANTIVFKKAKQRSPARRTIRNDFKLHVHVNVHTVLTFKAIMQNAVIIIFVSTVVACGHAVTHVKDVYLTTCAHLHDVLVLLYDTCSIRGKARVIFEPISI